MPLTFYETIKFHQEICILGSGPVGLCILKILIPPVVDPAHPPINIIINNMINPKLPHKLKLVLL